MPTTTTTTTRMTTALSCICYCLSLLLTCVVSASEDPIHVVIVGGGLSGLASALELERLGFSTTLVEASHRLGGRVASLSNDIELGGTYLHGSSSRLARLIEEDFHLQTVVSGGASAHPGKQSATWTYEGKVLNKSTTEERSGMLYQQWLIGVQAALKNYTNVDDDETVRHMQATSRRVREEVTSNSSLDRALLNFELLMGFQHDFGVPFSRLSLGGLYNNWDWRDHDGQDRVVGDGLESVVQAMQEYIRGEILLNSPVKKISHSNGTCELLVAGKKMITANACIVTVPIGVLKQQHDRLFSPPLPFPKQEALARAGVASYNTLILAWNKPLCQSGAYYLLNSDIDNDNPLSTGFVCPQVLRSNATSSHITQFYIHGDEHPFHDELYWRHQAVQVVNSVFSSSEEYKEEDIVDWNMTTWHMDPFIMGSYSAPTTSTRGNVDRAILQEPLDNTVFFAGEHTHLCGRYQSLDGAFDTGVYAARQVAASRRHHQGYITEMLMTCEETMAIEKQRTALEFVSNGR